MHTLPSDMKKAIQPLVPFHLIQGIRLAHALMESDHDIHVPREHDNKFAKLKEQFNVEYTSGTDGSVPVSQLRINHKEPVTEVGSISRPLIFPYAITRYCHSLWPEDRNIRVSFAGLITGKRRKVISEYCSNNFGNDAGALPDLNPVRHRVANRLRRAIGMDPASFSVEVGELMLWSSLRGRHFPVKSWDDEYFQMMSRSKAVLCPSGDYVWSYRFFEATLCGAIPIVEEKCDAYEGFVYHTMAEPLSGVKWTSEVARHNYELGCRRLTVPVDELNKELAMMVMESR